MFEEQEEQIMKLTVPLLVGHTVAGLVYILLRNLVLAFNWTQFVGFQQSILGGGREGVYQEKHASCLLIHPD